MISFHQLLQDVGNHPIRKSGVTSQEIVREACWVRSVSCAYGGKPPIELAFGRRPPDVMTVDAGKSVNSQARC